MSNCVHSFGHSFISQIFWHIAVRTVVVASSPFLSSSDWMLSTPGVFHAFRLCTVAYTTSIQTLAYPRVTRPPHKSLNACLCWGKRLERLCIFWKQENSLHDFQTEIVFDSPEKWVCNEQCSTGQPAHGDTTHQALSAHTTFSDLDHISWSQQCQMVLAENLMFFSSEVET